MCIFPVCVKERSLNAQEFSPALAVHGMLTTKIAEPRRSANRVANRTPGLFYRPYEDIIFPVCVKERSLKAQEFSQALAVHGMHA